MLTIDVNLERQCKAGLTCRGLLIPIVRTLAESEETLERSGRVGSGSTNWPRAGSVEPPPAKGPAAQTGPLEIQFQLRVWITDLPSTYRLSILFLSRLQSFGYRIHKFRVISERAHLELVEE